MSKYYCLIAGLPSISPDDAKLTYSVADFKAELEPVLSEQDKRIMRWFYFKFDNRNMMSFLKKKSDDQFDSRGNFSKTDIQDLFFWLKEENIVPKNIAVPDYIPKFIRAYYARLEEDQSVDFHLLEDQLSAFYDEEAMKCGNVFLSSWFEMNLNMGNLLASFSCRKYDLNKEQFIIGSNEVAEQLRQSSSREFHFGDLNEYMSELIQIVEEREPMYREKRLDSLRWKWLEEQTFFKVFDIESIITYMLRLEMIERWVALDKVRGEKTFRKLVSDMKQESAETLEEFKENNK
jgi:hypothetical protein